MVTHEPYGSAVGHRRAATATINLTVQQPQTRAGLAPSVDRVALEVDRETLGDMVRTFAGIRDQLSVMTNK